MADIKEIIVIKKLVRYIPRPLLCGARAAKILLRDYGQTRRNELGNCIDGQGKPIPWMTYPAIDFLKSYDLSTCDVFEFGSGSSTFFWAEHCKSVVSVEHYQPWYEKMRHHQNERITILPQYDLAKYPQEINNYGTFDLIVIDGAERMPSVKASLDHIKPHGIIIVDNSEWLPNCCTLLRQKGFSQYDFCGFTPLNSFTAMTSVFVRGEIVFPYKEKPAHWVPVGGKALDYFPPDDVF